MHRVLIVRGGAIGDFILTLPAIKALRDAWPDAKIEMLGYKHIAALAENRFYATAVRSIEYGPLSSFFAKNSELSSELRAYFAGFDLVVSYLYDPDGIFETNLRRCGAKRLVFGPARINRNEHAARQLARPLRELGIATTDFAPRIFPSAQDRLFGRTFLAGLSRPIVAMHPGSGGENKNWPIECWIQLANRLENDCSLVLVSGEADEARTTEFISRSAGEIRLARNLPLPELAAILERTIFVGHDSGISHLAGAVGAHCVVLFGPTDPAVWVPMNENVRVIRAPDRRMENLGVDAVYDLVAERLKPKSRPKRAETNAIKR